MKLRSGPSAARVAAAVELRRRQRAVESLHAYALSINIPTVPFDAMQIDESLLGPARNYMALHHAVILDVLERTMGRPYGRALIMAPPGSAKSIYATVTAPTWYMGKHPKEPLILTSYASNLIEKQSRRAQQIVRSPEYQALPWPGATGPLVLTKEAAHDWELSNGSSATCAGLTAGITGNRAAGWVIDDPVKGRDEADSPTDRQNVLDAYQDDLLTRCKPNAWGVLIMTRWHQQDLAGSILPDDYDGRSGMIRCRDGLDWEVLNIPAKAERADDPLGRRIGDYLWPEYFNAMHWQMHEGNSSREAQRVWSSLYQQRPTPQGAGMFAREHFQWYDVADLPPVLRLAGASDIAVTEDGGDRSEHSVWGMDSNGELWLIAGWTGQKTTDVTIEEWINLAARHGVKLWFDEAGVIHKAIAPALNRRMRERKVFMDVRALPSTVDKVARLQSFQARAAAGTVHLPRNGAAAVWAADLVEQLLALPAGRYDDKADCAGLIGRAVDVISNAQIPPPPERRGITPFTEEWLMYSDRPEQTIRLA